jgi:hypothetical protein
VESPSSSATCTRKPFSSPVAEECITRREPLASLTIDALTPPPAALILSRTCARVSVASTDTLTGVAPLLAVKLLWSADQVPSSSVKVPEPSVLAEEPKALLARDCEAASCCTDTL